MHDALSHVPELLRWDSHRDLWKSGLVMESRDGLLYDTMGVVTAPWSSNATLLYSDQETPRIVAKLQTGLDLIHQISPDVEDLLFKALRIVLLRKTDCLGSFSSASWNNYPGLTCIVNADRDDLGECWLMDALIHEAIHSLLYAIERLEPFYPASAAIDLTARSPWTGRALPLHSYVHACFVWFGLWSFWRMVHRQRILTDPSVSVLEARAMKGFGPGLLSALGKGEQLVSRRVRDAILSIEGITQEYVV